MKNLKENVEDFRQVHSFRALSFKGKRDEQVGLSFSNK